jgi:hypothetical protein
MQRADLVIRGKTEHTKRRHQIDVLLKRAMKGDRRAILKLYRDFGIKLYSYGEVEKYVQERVSQEYASAGKQTTNGPTTVSRRRGPKRLSKITIKQSRSRN